MFLKICTENKRQIYMVRCAMNSPRRQLRIHDDVCLPTGALPTQPCARGSCGVCGRIVFTDQLRTYSNGTYFDSCLYEVLSDKLAKLDASAPSKDCVDTVSGNVTDVVEAPLSPTSQAMDREIARIRKELQQHQDQPWEGQLDVADKLRADLDATLELDLSDSASQQCTPSPSKSLVECCSSLATARTPRPASLWQSKTGVRLRHRNRWCRCPALHI